VLMSHVGVTVLHVLIEPPSMTHGFPLINHALSLALPLHRWLYVCSLSALSFERSFRSVCCIRRFSHIRLIFHNADLAERIVH
jgi:hypothetical protein